VAAPHWHQDKDHPVTKLKRLPAAVAKATDGLPSALVLLIGGCCIVLAVALVWVFLPGGDEPAASPSTDETAAPVSRVATRPVHHRPGGFRLEVPREFRLKRDGKRLVMTTRDQQMVTTVTPTEPGPTDRVLDSLVDAVRAGYQDVEPGGRQLRRPDGRTIHVAVGKATNSHQVDLFYLAAVVRTGERNLAVTSFIAQDRAPSDVLPQLNALVNSLEPAGGTGQGRR
jgi:hypothetical protein